MSSVRGRSRLLPAILLMGVFLVAISGMAGPPAVYGDDSNLITLQLAETDLGTALRLLMDQSGINILVVGGEELASKKVTVNLSNVTLENALKTLAEGYGISWRRTGDGTYIINAKATNQGAAPAGATPANTGIEENQTPPAPVVEVETPKPQPKRRMEFAKIEVAFARLSDLGDILGFPVYNSYNNQVESIPGYQGRIPDIVRKNNSAAQPVYGPATDPNAPNSNYGNESNIPSDGDRRIQQMMGGGGGMRGGGGGGFGGGGGMRGGGGGGFGGGGGGMRGGGGGGFGGQGGGGGFGGGGGGFGGQGGGGFGGQGGVGGGGAASNLLPEGIDSVVGYEIDNAIIVRGDPEAIEELKELIRMFDVAPLQIQIKVDFVSINVTDSNSLGIDWTVRRLDTSIDTNFGPAGDVIVGIADGNVRARLATAVSNNRAKLITGPLVTTFNNVWANVQFGREVPYFTSTLSGGGIGQNPVVSIQPNYLTVDTSLYVLPKVNGDGSINVLGFPQVSDSSRFVTGPQGFIAPIVEYQTVQINRRVQDGETIVIGGLTKKSDSRNLSKVPILGDLPIIGTLFQNRSRLNDETELLVFVTPTLIRDRSNAGSSITLGQ
ncbi:MAG: secretin and TonB N-terminal domain-containing protein [Armatimonadetes bacterium]|nr:secretin and TonB N-terminal domain-containing protein [Armatimonadota bacterium]